MISLTKDDGVWIATIDRQDKANSLTPDMLEHLGDIALDAQGAARVLIFTGAGKVFSAGADLEAAKAGLATSPLWERLSGAIANFKGLSICAMNGTAAGGAMGMVLACDLRIARPGAKTFYPVMKLGYLPQPSDPARLAKLIGPARAKMILMAGQKVPVEEAMTWGLVDHITDGDVIEAARELSEAVLAATPEHASAIKRMIETG
ncbi:MAG: enoyl-CoA hydratase/isomerase family protein [Pelagimonas sp.]|jgi:enoyl-CoA hydratase/carnithine racemase|nr:enoyl-CoA hydratase/isomerase family protein [Pelagimonas sp.]